MGPLLSLLLLLLLTLEAALLRMIGTPSAPQWAWREHSLRDGKRKQSEEEANKERWEMKPWKCLISGDCPKLARKVSDSLTLTAISMESKRTKGKEPRYADYTIDGSCDSYTDLLKKVHCVDTTA